MRMRATCWSSWDPAHDVAVTHLDVRAPSYEDCVDALGALLPAGHKIVRFQVDRG